ncbi:hypothetical protein ACFZCL_30985 [Streptomyces sp. NPDC008159]|uniref:hypothetical protein n=1 Tax=Streptomyces sp. NPDC008159 TaxID=3364817 RepID=UPI0036E16864
MGVWVAAVPLMSPVAAADSCGDSFGEKVTCGSAAISKGAVVITLNSPLEYRKLNEAQRASLENLRKDTNPLVVQVPKGISTGEGGTALLLMADGRLVDPDATIEPLGPDALTLLTEAGVCENKELCDSVDSGPTGEQFIDKGFAADYSDHSLVIDPLDTDATTKSPGSSHSDDKNSKGDQGKGGKGDKGDTAQAGGGGTEAAGDSTSWAALWMGLLLVLLLLAFAVVIRRSRGPVAVGHRTGSGRLAAMPPGGGARRREPRPADGRSPTHGAARGGDGRGGDGRAPTQAAPDGDESTTRLRVAPTARHGRQVSARPAHTRTAVVRTELHPQGYVELDRVLYRAVWAEAGRPPPAPGGLVDVAEAPERDSDVLYAFPPAAARHAKGTPR